MVHLVALLTAFSLSAEQKAPVRTVVNPEIQRLVDLALTCQPAFRADALLKIVELAPAQSARWRKSLLELAFEAAEETEAPYPLLPVPVSFTDTVPAMLAISSRLRVDRLSLQLRAAEAMARLDRKRGLEMFEEIPDTVLPRIFTCDELTVPDVRIYYQGLQAFAQIGFSAAEIRRGDREGFLLRHLRSLQSPLQVPPAAAALAQLDVSPEEIGPLVDGFAASMASIRGDDRSYTMAFLEGRVTGSIRSLLERLGRDGIATAPVENAFESFYGNYASGKHCADTAQSKPLQDRMRQSLTELNELPGVRAAHEQLALPKLDGNYEKAGAPEDIWRKSDEYRSFLQMAAKISGAPWDSPADREVAFDGLLEKIDLWERSDPLTPPEFFIVKATVLQRVWQLTLGPESRGRAAEAYVHFFEASIDEEQAAPSLWLWGATKALKPADKEALEVIAVKFKASRSAALRLYAELARPVQ